MNTQQPVNATALLPCPFCGWKGAEASHLDWRDESTAWVVSCDDTRGGCGVITDHYLTEQHAQKAWNRRSALRDQSKADVVEAAATIIERMSRNGLCNSTVAIDRIRALSPPVSPERGELAALSTQERRS